MATALTTVAQAKAHLSITASDSSQNARLELFINAATSRIETMTDRKLKERTHVEYRSGKRSNEVMLLQYPVSSIIELSRDNESIFPSSSIISPSQYALDASSSSVVLLKDVFPSGIRNIKVTYVAGYNETDHPGNLAELEICCLWIVEWFYKHRERGDMGRTQKSKGDESVGILAEMPKMISEMILQYKRIEMPLADRMIEQL